MKVKMRMKKMRLTLQKEGKLGRRQETLMINLVVGFRHLFYIDQHMVLHKIDKLDKIGSQMTDPCVHMVWCGLCSFLRTSYRKNYKVENKTKIERK